MAMTSSPNWRSSLEIISREEDGVIPSTVGVGSKQKLTAKISSVLSVEIVDRGAD